MCDLLRQQGILTEKTLQRFYGMKRFEQIAESNAIEGSTLSVAGDRIFTAAHISSSNTPTATKSPLVSSPESVTLAPPC